MTSDHPVKRRKKLIEVAIPLEAINAASAREKSIRHGHPSTLHLWWARRPLAAARAVIFCQMVDDPSAVPEEFSTEEAQEKEKERLFEIVKKLVLWESTNDEKVIEPAREEIRRSWRRCCVDNADHPDAEEFFNPERLPGFHDPFAGGGALPLEAQRLGLESYASDLNPVAVLINKAMIEIPPKFAGMPPINPEARVKKQLIAKDWKGADGLAEDVRHYGKWMRDEAAKRIGHLYPKVKITADLVNNPENPRPDLKPYEGQELTVIAWVWARTVKSPNPAFSSFEVPLASTFMLSTKKGTESFIEPLITENGYQFAVKNGRPEDIEAARNGTKLSRGGNFRCLMSGEPMNPEYIKAEGNAGRIRSRMMAVIAETARGRVYLPPTHEQESAAFSAVTIWEPEGSFVEDARAFTPHIYGIKEWKDLFTRRQLATLATFSDLVQEIHAQARKDANSLQIDGDEESRRASPVGDTDRADAISTFLAFAGSRMADRHSSLCRWDPNPGGYAPKIANTFGRQALPMVWDFVEGNPLSSSSGNLIDAVGWVAKVLDTSLVNTPRGSAIQCDAQSQELSLNRVVSTDPPYYDNIAYADLSDFFYVWLRRSIRNVFPKLLATMTVPKAEELVATAYRHGGKSEAEEFFLDGMTLAMTKIAGQSHQCFPVTIYYAFKQAESKSALGTASTGWETFLAAVIKAGFTLRGTWPMRTELANRIRGVESNALATSVVLVCERRDSSATTISRTEFRRQLRDLLPQAIRRLEQANIAPVDMAQAAIGPGMAIFSGVRAVLNPDDSPMTVREALIEINSTLDEYLSQEEGELDAESRFALTFFESFGYQEREYGDAEGLAVARNISVDGVARAGILRSLAGKVRLLQRSELPAEWDPFSDKRLCVWEATQYLIKRLETGEQAAGILLAQLKDIHSHGDLPANCRALAYRLYNHCERSKQAEEARAYNGLVIAWPELEKLAALTDSPVQHSLL
jgi:putative DNA methylase